MELVHALLVSICIFGLSEARLHHRHPDVQAEREANLKWPVDVRIDFPELPVFASKCPHEWPTKYAIVTAGTRHNTDWLDGLRPDMTALKYQAEDKAAPHYYDDTGYEAAAYVTFMVEYYDCLPEAVAFVHGHSEAWHHAANFTESLKVLQWDKIPGYTDLNRQGVWSVRLKHRAPYPLARPVAEGDEVYSGKHDPSNIHGGVAYDSQGTLHWQQPEYSAMMWDNFFGPLGLGPLPEYVSFVCCGQFAVTKERILLHSRRFWELNLHALTWNTIQATEGLTKGYYTSDTWVIMWAILFGEDHDYQKTVPDEVLFPGVPLKSN